MLRSVLTFSLILLISLFAVAEGAFAQTANLGIPRVTPGQAQKEVTINEDFDYVDAAIAGREPISVASLSSLTLTSAQARNMILEFTGAQTSNTNVIVPSTNKAYVIYNATTGGSWTLTVKTSAGTGVTVTRGARSLLYCDGTNVVLVGTDATASSLRSATTVVNVSAATAPSAGQVLTATDSTHATWQAPPAPTGAWTNYTPTITPGAGSFTSVSATGYWQAIGKTVHVRIIITITTNGTAASYVDATLPVATPNDKHQSMPGRENAVTGKALSAALLKNTTTARITLYDGTYPGASGYELEIQGVYESQ